MIRGSQFASDHPTNGTAFISSDRRWSLSYQEVCCWLWKKSSGRQQSWLCSQLIFHLAWTKFSKCQSTGSVWVLMIPQMTQLSSIVSSDEEWGVWWHWYGSRTKWMGHTRPAGAHTQPQKEKKLGCAKMCEMPMNLTQTTQPMKSCDLFVCCCVVCKIFGWNFVFGCVYWLGHKERKNC